MGDRNNPIKFGPEWLRNFAQERSGVSSSTRNQANSNFTGSGEQGASGASGGAGGGSSSSSCNVTSTSCDTSSATGSSAAASSNSTGAIAKIQLAKLRYGREEMLALYERTAEAPPELKYIDFLYQSRGKPPFALNNTFEDEMESGPSMERYPVGRGLCRGAPASDRGRPRMSFVRSASTGRGHWPSWHLGGGGSGPRMLFNPDEETPQRPWSSSNGGPANRSSGDQAEWMPNKMYRSKRQGQATNWRQAREEGEEWRSSDAAPTSSSARARTNQDKWVAAERDWGDRPNPDKSQNRNNRRTWVGSESQNDELPEWAVDGAEACGGTFDSSGAFHGYSNDDTNVPKAQETNPLTRSHTHGSLAQTHVSFVRSKTMEEGSEEWWASEKAKKLSPKRFDASDVKFNKKPPTDTSKAEATNAPQEESGLECLEPLESDNADSTIASEEDVYVKKNAMKQKFTESKTFDSLMRTSINLEEANDERGNFQSVMITPNNSLRQKHQNIVSSAPEVNRMQSHRPPLLNLLGNSSASKFSSDSDYDNSEEKLVDDLIDLNLTEKEMIVISKMPLSTSSQMMNPSSSAMAAAMPTSVNSMPQMQNASMQMRISSPIHNQGLMQKPNLPPAMQGPGMPAGLQQPGLQKPGLQQPGLQQPGLQQPGLQQPGLQQPGLQQPGLQQPGLQQQSLQQVGIPNSALNASLGLPIRPHGVSSMVPPMGLRMQGMPPNMLPNAAMPNPGLNSSGLPAGLGAAAMPNNASGLPGFQGPAGLQSMASSNMTNNSLFMSQNTNNGQMANHASQPNMFPMHSLQHSGSQPSFSIYGNMMQTPPPPLPSAGNQSEMWYYEDPKKTIQGPFSSKEMLNWYRAGFFTQNLMVRRACDANMRPLGSYGPVVPFAQVDILSTFPRSTAYEPRPQGPHDNMLNSQPGLGLESVDSLWNPPTPAPDMMWMQQAMNARNDTHVNNLPMYFWEDQPTTIAPTLLPEDITKEMKTEDQILAQMRAAQNINTQANMSFMKEPPPSTIVASKPEEVFIGAEKATPNLEELQKLIHKDILSAKPAVTETNVQSKEPEEIFQQKPEKTVKEPVAEPVAKTQKQTETKASKQAKNETEKTKAKEASTKTKAKKAKDDKKEEEVKKDEEIAKPEKRSVESSPIKNKKEEKSNKKELEKEKKEWLKEGFTIVKGPEKNNNKESKKKVDEAKASEEAERKKKEEERLAVEEEKKRKQLEAIKKQQEQQIQAQQRQATESVIKKAPWSAVANQTLQATNKDGLTLAEIQRLEREKKLEQMKEQQQMMQIIAQQQAAALQREQEMQAGLGWAKKKGNNLNAISQSLAEIQAEARKQAAAAAAAIQVIEEPASAPAVINHVPWGNSHNGAVGGFWDTQPNSPPKVEKPQEPKLEVSKPKKKPTVVVPVKKETSPAAEFDVWCSTVLSSWSAKIDVPTFVGFLKDIESPYEVKDYVKCYLGETKDSSDFARQFLERRSKLLRVGMVTPSDDLCSPAIAVNPRTISGSDYQEVKGKGKKTKKNKMLKVDARILGFSVTASEDRINVGDIDSV